MKLAEALIERAELQKKNAQLLQRIEGNALVQEGDVISIDIPARKLDLLVDEAELERRRARLRHPEKENPYPVLRRYARLVSSAANGGRYKEI